MCQWIGGTGNTIKIHNPKDESLVSEDLHAASHVEVDNAVDHALEAFETGPWSSFTGEKRGICLNRLADLIEEHVEEIAYFESIASGRPLTATQRDVPMFAKVFRCMRSHACHARQNTFENRVDSV